MVGRAARVEGDRESGTRPEGGAVPVRAREASAQRSAGVGVGGTAPAVRRLLLGGSRAHAWETRSGRTRLSARAMSSQSPTLLTR
jgi:hypothetical protein